jgi:hypothetical protein
VPITGSVEILRRFPAFPAKRYCARPFWCSRETDPLGSLFNNSQAPEPALRYRFWWSPGKPVSMSCQMFSIPK